MGQVIDLDMSLRDTMLAILASPKDAREGRPTTVIVYGEKTDGEWRLDGRALQVVTPKYVEPEDESPGLKVNGFDYFLEDFLIRQTFDSYSGTVVDGQELTVAQILLLVIHFAEHNDYADPEDFFSA